MIEDGLRRAGKRKKPPADLLGPISFDMLGALIPAQDDAGGVHHIKGVVFYGIDEQLEAFFAAQEVLFGLFDLILQRSFAAPKNGPAQSARGGANQKQKERPNH